MISFDVFRNGRLVLVAKAGMSDSSTIGGLTRDSFARPGKLFTANEGIIVRSVGQLSTQAHGVVIEAMVTLLRGEAQ